MIEKIHIQNFKSIYDLELEVGRVNLFIGENGSGKSNLLEALVFVSASESNMLANEFLVSRGLRVPEPELMRSAFEEGDKEKYIFIDILLSSEKFMECYTLSNDNEEYSIWKNDKIRSYYTPPEYLRKSLMELDKSKNSLSEEEFRIKRYEIYDKMMDDIDILDKEKLINFIIYSPENTALRIFEKEKQIQPLGINGEGLLKLLKVINNYEDKSYRNTIIESLQLFNWFEDITIPTDISSIEDKVIIKDKYLYREFTQRSANEGFLFILFYITLIVAKETPKAFAIDNIDASLNPKLCTKLMTILVHLAKKYDKQIFLTTHNPAILDGIDLNDKEQKLFVVSRNKKGHTRMKEITAKDKPKSSTNEPLKLSEAFLRGYLGGLPKGF
jgi:predicted ATPase